MTLKHINLHDDVLRFLDVGDAADDDDSGGGAPSLLSDGCGCLWLPLFLDYVVTAVLVVVAMHAMHEIHQITTSVDDGCADDVGFHE